MTDLSDIVDRADTLMRRRRSFVATAPGKPSPEPRAPSIEMQPAREDTPEDDDVPVLTDVVPVEAAVSEPAAVSHFDETQVAILASDIAHSIGQQLAHELPTLLEAVLTNAAEELRDGITATMETALRDFIARRRQLHLPLDEPDRHD